MKIFVLGDIHGRLKALRQVFERASFDFENDMVVQIGDLTDRGAEPFECIEFFEKIQNKVMIIGNHDLNLTTFIKTGHDMFNGGHGFADTKRQWQRLSPERQDLVIRILEKQIPYYVDEANRCFVHGGWDRDYKIAQHDVYSLSWNRELWQKAMSCKGNDKLKTVERFSEIYIGHTPTIMWDEFPNEGEAPTIITSIKTPIVKPMLKGGVCNMDTGAGFTMGKLSMMNVETKELFQSDLISTLYE